MATRPFGLYDLYWQCRIQGAGAYGARELIIARPCVPTMKIASSPAMHGVIFRVNSNFGEWVDRAARRSWKLVVA